MNISNSVEKTPQPVQKFDAVLFSQKTTEKDKKLRSNGIFYRKVNNAMKQLKILIKRQLMKKAFR